jgi:hypothetical protein
MTLEQELTERTERMNQSRYLCFLLLRSWLPARDFTVKFNKLTVKLERPELTPPTLKD